MATQRILKSCKNGHRYYKSSDCPVCPFCEKERRPEGNFLSLLAAPARRALENNGISTLQQLSTFSKEEILSFHGIGKSSIPKLEELLAESNLAFAKK